MNQKSDPFDACKELGVNGKKFTYYSLNRLEEMGLAKISKLPHSIKILLESVLRNVNGSTITEEDVRNLAAWKPNNDLKKEIPFIPARVILQDFTGVPAVVDFAALRSAMERLGGDPKSINPVIPAVLVIDHSIQVDHYGTILALKYNEKKEFERNRERYTFLRWAQQAFDNFKVVPPGKGIIHQVNLEFLSSPAQYREVDGKLIVFPDSVLGTDSHTTMIGGLGVLGWGVGGIEAEATMLGQPYYMPIPEVIGMKVTGELDDKCTATDLVLTITELLRKKGVVGKFIEFFGPGLKNLDLAERATISNMTPEYGATVVYFPIDDETLRYLKLTGREHLISLVKEHSLQQGLFLNSSQEEPQFSDVIELDLSTVEPCLAGPKRPQDRIPLGEMKSTFNRILRNSRGEKTNNGLKNGDVVIAAITSCTNTSNPSVLIGAGLLARNAVKRGLRVRPHVKTSLAPGSRVVTDYLELAGLLPYLEALGFHVVGYGCTTCIGNSGPLPKRVSDSIQKEDLVVAAVVSGNRNFEGRINSLVKANYLASPALVVAYSLAGTVCTDLTSEPIGTDPNGTPVYLKEIWPSKKEIQKIMDEVLSTSLFKKQYSNAFEGSDLWRSLKAPSEELYVWDEKSSYIREPPFFKEFPMQEPGVEDILEARVLAVLGDSITTDHISPAGTISPDSPAGQYLISHGVQPSDFNSFGSRRGNHEVMMRGTFGNIRLRNMLVPGKEGGWTKHFPSGEIM
ncbi:MAG: aconitate hydratase AcnA, partial [Candidatus Helarchaeales archaeon]